MDFDAYYARQDAEEEARSLQEYNQLVDDVNKLVTQVIDSFSISPPERYLRLQVDGKECIAWYLCWTYVDHVYLLTDGRFVYREGQVFHPVRLSHHESYQDISAFEKGVGVPYVRLGLTFILSSPDHFTKGCT